MDNAPPHKTSKSLSPEKDDIDSCSDKSEIAEKRTELKRALDENTSLKSTCKRLRMEIAQRTVKPKKRKVRSASF